uniref:Ovule protein n=1 Tax=Steinernema glaseri TaxID=37863 RepID=A0A1I7ZMJ2_9BILA
MHHFNQASLHVSITLSHIRLSRSLNFLWKLWEFTFIQVQPPQYEAHVLHPHHQGRSIEPEEADLPHWP